MVTSLCGTCRIRHWLDNSKVTRMALRVSTSPPMVRSSGQEVLTIPSVRGIYVKADSCSSTTLIRKYSPLVFVPPASGWQLEWRIRTLRCYTPRKRTSINYTCTNRVYCRWGLPHAASGSFLQGRIINWMLGVRLMGHRYFRLVR